MASLNSLVEAAKVSLSENDHIKARSLLEEALPVAGPLRPRLLLSLLEINSSMRDWESVRILAREAIRAPMLQKHDLIFAAALMCFAASVVKGQRAAMKIYRVLKPHVTRLVEEGGAITEAYGLTFAASVRDDDWSDKFFRSVMKYGEETPVALSNITSLESWAESKAASIIWLEQPEKVFCASRQEASQVWQYSTDGHCVISVRDAEVLPGWPYPKMPSGEILEKSDLRYLRSTTSGVYPHFLVPTMNRVFHLWPSESTYIDARALSFFGHHIHSAGHVIVDYLPRLRNLYEDQDLKVAVPAKMHEKYIELLSLFGISEARIIRCAFGSRYRFRELVIADPGTALCPSPENVRFVGQALRKAAGHINRKSRLFIERGRPTRAVANRDQLYAELSGLGFERICLEAMSIFEQREIIADAEVVVATHGSDLLAYYFMAPGSHLVELSWDATLNAAAAPSCHFLGVNYHRLICLPAQDNKKTKMKKDRDFVVDCVAFRTLISNIDGHQRI